MLVFVRRVESAGRRLSLVSGSACFPAEGDDRDEAPIKKAIWTKGTNTGPIGESEASPVTDASSSPSSHSPAGSTPTSRQYRGSLVPNSPGIETSIGLLTWHPSGPTIARPANLLKFTDVLDSNLVSVLIRSCVENQTDNSLR